jgi:hypothetical protein
MALNAFWKMVFRIKKWWNTILDSTAVIDALTTLFSIAMLYLALGVWFAYTIRLVLVAVGLYATGVYLTGVVLEYATRRSGGK